MSQASEFELLMLGLVNYERTSRGLDPLSINGDLNESSEDHSQWMLDTDTFSHRGASGSSPTERIEGTAYELTGSWRTAENIGWQSERGEPGIEDDVREIHAGLMASPGHRANLLNPDLKDIGIGIEVGDFDGFEAVMVTQNFATTDAVTNTPDQEVVPDTPIADAGDVDDPVPPPASVPTTPVAEEIPVADNGNDDTPDKPKPQEDPVETETADADIPDGTTDDSMPVDDEMVVCLNDATDPNAAAVTTVTPPTAAKNGAAPITIPISEMTEAEVTGDLTDVFTFVDFDGTTVEDAGDDDTLLDIEGMIPTANDTETADDWVIFDTLLAQLFEDAGNMTCGATVDFI